MDDTNLSTLNERVAIFPDSINKYITISVRGHSPHAVQDVLWKPKPTHIRAFPCMGKLTEGWQTELQIYIYGLGSSYITQ